MAPACEVLLWRGHFDVVDMEMMCMPVFATIVLPPRTRFLNARPDVRRFSLFTNEAAQEEEEEQHVDTHATPGNRSF